MESNVAAIPPRTTPGIPAESEGMPQAYTTIMTTLDRLFHKGLLGREREGTAGLYTPSQSRADYERSLAGALAERIVDEHGDVGLAAFVDVAASDDLLDRLAALVEERRRTRSVPKGEG